MHKKIFVIGFPKGGTTSIHYALQNAGINSLHWAWYDSPSHLPSNGLRFNRRFTSVGMMIKYAKEAGLPLLHYMHGYDAFTQMDISLSKDLCYWPQFLDVPLLDKQYPESKFIFNTRPVHKWINSVRHWGDLTIRLTKLDIPGLPYGYGEEDKHLKDWHDWHLSNMVDYFKDKPNKLVVYNIENDPVSKLSDFLGLNLVMERRNVNKRNPANHSPS